MNRAEELSALHWKYIEGVLYVSGVEEKEVKKIGYFYKTAMFHGYNHGWEDSQNFLKEMNNGNT